MSKILAVDWGSKRVGLAIADEVAKLASPLPSLSAGPKLLAEIKRICHDEDVARIVVGLPRNLEGQETAQAAKVRQFGKQLAAATGLSINFQDETLTSLVSRDKPHPPTDIDSAAASLILEDYLGSL